MKLSVGLKVANSLSLTPQLQQAIRLLQLSNLELEQEIQLQLESNPLLEQIDDENSISTLSNSNNTDIHELDQSLNADHLPEELPVDTHWDEVYIHQSTALETPEFQEQEDNNHKSLNLKQHLLEQINLLHFSQIDQLIAYCLVDSLDQRGFLEAEIEEITASVQNLLAEMGHEEEVEDDEVYVVLKHIQQLDPLGAGSRNLAECLRIQLEALPSVPVIQDALILLEHYHLLIANDLGKLLKQTGLNTERLKSAINMLKTLKAYPGIEFEDESSNYQIPDVIVSKKDQIWHVQLNTDILPKLRINSFYAGMIRRADQSTDNNYLKDQLYEAKNFIKSIDERHKTLLKVASCIVEHQRTFFEIGAEGMKPLILREVAEEVQLHESTVSRVTSNKYMLTPRGLFELKYFFSSHVGTTSGGEASSTAIRAMIKKLVSNENPRKPLSDNSITNLLKEEGIDVARRTVAKYRESLNIPSSSDRKVLI
ncbi:RNA polymerase factor sigma-54 [Acinetobacter radioresistens]|jgi:RNA polymerase sigma-54 factor|uniref:RNA polymerase sigma-54 factor n=1 Tax=Acinetobacter radioresistens TaxID=40216 RepID=A0A8H2PUH8_ACIRA|nr:MULTISPECIES: RNA polymerase factor sigma-54 [Acinetobacter]ENV86006.1 RNA polymerase sigma-54 factor [Acinetobacter radioresistens DSM 6976 = NBRC 102413 = CIP 103788]EXB33236.1 RNA polymerase sigma-54 factor [Acinetobacter sp. 1461402]EXB68290.1 RNA polymerase sigma-54 factor [Acinetobacter sp. 230853]EXC32407.1 RNA polymerase sigma-54 factor [Acinetobacter sp. 869535]EXE15348.1 RNA polymerase sigma-54 factor [Acinetobacter sp. 983759]